MTVEGVDYSWDHPDPAGLVAAGKEFVVRYGGPGQVGKLITATEVQALLDAGLSIVANAEDAKAVSRFSGAEAGYRWATLALDHWTSVGMPDGRPIYFSVDWDAGPADWPGIDAATASAGDVLGAEQVGIYGGYRTVEHCYNAGVRWLWQTYAWSAGQWHPAAQLQQYRNGVVLAGGTVDLDRSTVDDFGQWGQTGGTMARLREIVIDGVAYPVRQYTSPNLSQRQLEAHHGLVLHYTAGNSYTGDISWQMNPDQRYSDGTSVNSASTWICGRNVGEIAQMGDAEWQPSSQRAGNRTWNSVELVGIPPAVPTDWQKKVAAYLLWWLHTQHSEIPLAVANNPDQRGLGHHSMDREGIDPEWGHDECPGAGVIAAKPWIVTQAKAIAAGKVDDMSAADAKQGVYDAFAEAATGGEASTPFGRQLREYVRAVTGGPVDGAALLAAIQQNHNVDETVLATALAPLLLAGMPTGNLTQDQVEQALRNVLTTGTNG